jgi:hypothetical protein
MTGYRLIDLDSIRWLSRLINRFASEANMIATNLSSLDTGAARTIDGVAGRARESAVSMLVKAAAAEPRPQLVASPATVAWRQGPTPTATDSLDVLIQANRARAWTELWAVVAQLNRLAALDIRAGPVFDGLRQDYDTLARLVGTNLVYFSVDSSAPIGKRSSRAGYRAGVWIGPAEAEHVLVMIPGMNTSTASWLAADVPDAEALQRMAADLAVRHDLGEVAVVPLLSYAPPQTFLDAPLGHFWRDGSGETAEVLEGLPLESRHVVGWGHSYGATVLGAASARSGVFDDLVMVGAAGTGTETLEDLGVDGDHLYVATNWNDPIRLVPNEYHGVSPLSLPHVRIPTAPEIDFDLWKVLISTPWFLLDGLPDHDYLDDQTAKQAFAAIAIGLDDITD